MSKETDRRKTSVPDNQNSTLRRTWTDPFFRLPNEVIDHPEDCPPLTTTELAVFIVLCRYGNNDGSAFPSYQKIADGARCSRRAAIRAVARLEEVGLLKKKSQFSESGDATSNLYEIYLPSQLRKNDAPHESRTSFDSKKTAIDGESGVVTHSHYPSDSQSPYKELKKNKQKELQKEDALRVNTPGQKSTVKPQEQPPQQETPEDRKAKAETLTPELKASIAAAVARIQRAGKTSTMQDVFQPLLE